MSVAGLTVGAGVIGGGEAGPSASMLARVHLAYAWRHRRRLDLIDPRRFTELVQWRKLHDRDPRLPRLIDKVGVKAFVRDRIGTDWVTPTLWHGTTLPLQPEWALPFVVKSRHGCNQRRFVFDMAHDWQATRRAGTRWMRNAYGHWLAEWGYAAVPRGILVEPFVGGGHTLPIDYKLYVFHGRVAAVQVHLDRATDHRWILLDRSWRDLSGAGEVPRRPVSLDAMIAAAEELGRGFASVRIDFYDAAPHPRFGEMTFYPGSGLDRFAGRGVDEWLGGLWRDGGPAAAMFSSPSATSMTTSPVSTTSATNSATRRVPPATPATPRRCRSIGMSKLR